MTTRSAFGFEISGTNGTRVVRATGRLVAGAGADAPEWAATGALGNVERVVMDLGDVTAIDAGGVGRLVGLRQLLACRGARLTIASASPRVRRVLRLTALDAIFGIAPGDGRHDRSADGPPMPARLGRCA
jgi:anti-anti-sigma factor